MSDFLATLAAQALGAAPLALPLVPARYAPMPPIGGVGALEGLLDGKDRRAAPAAQAETSLTRIDLPPPLFRPVEHDSPYRPFSWLPIIEIAEPWVELSPTPAAGQEPGGAPTSAPGPDMGTARSTTVLAEAHVPSDRKSAETATSTPIARQPSGSNTPLSAASPRASDRSDRAIAPSETRVGLADPAPAVAASQGAESHAPAAQVDPSTPDFSEPRMTAPMPPAPVTLDAAIQRTAVTPDRVSPPAPAITMPAAVAHQAGDEDSPNDAGEMAVHAARATAQPGAPSAQVPVGTPSAALRAPGSTPAAESAAVQHGVVASRTSQPERAIADQAAGAVRPAAPALGPADGQVLRPLAIANPTTGRVIRVNDGGRARSETGPSTQRDWAEAGPSTQRDRSETGSSGQRDRSETGPSGQRDRSETGPSIQQARSETSPSTQRDRAETGPSTQRDRAETGPSTQRDRAETGPSIQRDRSETGPSTQRDRAETGPSTQRNRAETGPSIQRDRSETGPDGAGEMAGQAMVRPVLPASDEQAAMQGRADRNRAASAPAPLPTIRVTIGRIEVRSSTPARQPAPVPAPRPRPALSLDDYLKRPAKVRP